MLVNAYSVLNYNRCRRFAALNDPYTALYLNEEFYEENSLFRDIFLSHIYHPNKEIRKNVNLTFEFEHEITLSENYDFLVDEKYVYCVLPNSAREFLNLKYRDGSHKYQVFTKNPDGIYRVRKNVSESKNFQEKMDKLKSHFEGLGRIVFSFALKNYILKKSSPLKSYKLRFVLLNSDYKFDGISYSDKLYHIFDFSNLDGLDEMVEIALFRMINHIELNDFTPCVLVKKACGRNRDNECKFVKFCYSHLPKDTSILEYFNSHYGFLEPTNHGNIHHDTYDLLNDGYVSMQDIPLSWLNDQNHLMQRYCIDNSTIFFHNNKIEKGLSELKYPLYFLDFEAVPRAIPKFKGESPYSQSVFQYSIHIQNTPDEDIKIYDNHHSFIANPSKDERKKLLESMLNIFSNHDSSIVVYNKTFEKTRFEEFKEEFPEYKNKINKIIDRLFDLLDIVKINRAFYLALGFEEKDLESYNLYHPDLGGSYSLKKVIKLFNPEAYEDLLINDGVKAYKAYLKISDSSKVEKESIERNLFKYCRQDTYSMYEIIQGLKKLLNNPYSSVNNS